MFDEHVEDIIMYLLSKKHFFKISRNSEANASEFFENREEMFFHYLLVLVANEKMMHGLGRLHSRPSLKCQDSVTQFEIRIR